MFNIFFKNISYIGIALSVVSAALLLFIKGWIWSVGVLTGSSWVFINSYFLYQLFQMGLNPRSNKKEKILIFSILKFPVLYLAGFFILSSRFFPVYSLVLGLTLYFVALGIVWVLFNLNVMSSRSVETRDQTI